MGLVIHQEAIDAAKAESLVKLCPFGAISYDEGKLAISSVCKMCKLCVKKGPQGAVTFEEEAAPVCDKAAWNGVAVFAEQHGGKVHPVSPELVGKARELAAKIHHPVLAVLIGHELDAAAQELLTYGVDKVCVYDHPALKDFAISPYANCLRISSSG